MALHRDIYWVGKQWAVTGHGIQACNQKQRGQFDIEGTRLWEDGVQDAVRAEKWVNTDDFEKAVAIARKYYPEPPRKAPPAEPVPPPDHTAPAQVPLKQVPLKPAVAPFELRIDGVPAKWRPVWRIRTRGRSQP